jgi:hypothetical protein
MENRTEFNIDQTNTDGRSNNDTLDYQPASDTRMSSQQYRQIPGWGADIDPENEPNYPMKRYTGDDHQRIYYERPTLQRQKVEVLHSNERPSLTATFGTTVPPSGLSGMLRRYAFRYSESHWFHWLPLVMADRIGVVEGIVDDLRKGHVPNIFAEMGWKSEWQYNKPRAIRKIVVATAVTSAMLYLLLRKKKSSRLSL